MSETVEKNVSAGTPWMVIVKKLTRPMNIKDAIGMVRGFGMSISMGERNMNVFFFFNRMSGMLQEERDQEFRK